MIAAEDIVPKMRGVAMPPWLSSPDRGDFLTRMPRLVRRLLQRWWIPHQSDRYRPEKHYMRGPGPKNLSRHPRQD
jgi:hypothetical protein